MLIWPLSFNAIAFDDNLLSMVRDTQIGREYKYMMVHWLMIKFCITHSAHMPAFKVKLTPLTPSGSVFHPKPMLPDESKQEIVRQTSTKTRTPNLSTLLDWPFDKLLPGQFPHLPSTPEELNTMFSPVFGSFTAQTPTFPDFELGNYDAHVEAFCANNHPFFLEALALPAESAAELWELPMDKSLFLNSGFTPEYQENQFVESGFEEFAGFGVAFDEPQQSPLEGSYTNGHSG